MCASCGGGIVSDASMAVTTCLYCEDPVVLKGSLLGIYSLIWLFLSNWIKKAAKEASEKHYQGKKLLSKILKDENRLLVPLQSDT